MRAHKSLYTITPALLSRFFDVNIVVTNHSIL
jgi:hypothetical protein